MEGWIFNPRSAAAGEPRWGRMILLSVVAHLAVFSTLFFAPGTVSFRPRGDVVYEVDLVEIPKSARPRPQARKAKTAVRAAKSRPRAKPSKAERIARVRAPKEKPVVIAKRTLKRGKTAPKKTAPTRLIDQAVAKIQRKVKARKEDPLERAVSEIRKKVGEEKPIGPRAPGQGVGVPFQLYMMRVEEWIKSNWSYPTAMAGDRGLENIQAVVVLNVKNDGTILDSRFLKRSSDLFFDDSVKKAIERSNPLPPFPPGYVKSREEIEINFNLSELAGD